MGCSGNDRLAFDQGEVLHSELLPVGKVAAAHIAVGLDNQDADDYFVLDPATGVLYIDLNGDQPGSSAAVATLVGVTTIREGDIWIT